MRIVITGHRGFIGSKVVDALKSEHEIYGITCANYQDFENELTFLESCFTDFDLLIHCGAITDPNAGNRLWQMNYKATQDIGGMCKGRGAKMIFISSAAAVEPANPYGWSKMFAEIYLRYAEYTDWHRDNLCILRPYNVWGFDDGKSPVWKLIHDKLPQLYRGYTRDFTYVYDVVKAITSVVSDWRSETYDVGTCAPTLITDLAEAIGVHTLEIVDCPDEIKLVSVACPDNLIPGYSADNILKHLAFIKKSRSELL